MLCDCQKKYLEHLKVYDKEAAMVFVDASAKFPKQLAFQVECEQLCQKAKDLISLHFRVEIELAARLAERKMDPQHFQLLCEHLVSVATLSFS